MTDDQRANPRAADATPRDPLSMDTDNTPEGRIYGDTVEGGPIADVREGQIVVDALGVEIGKVDMVRMGDPTAATTRGQEPQDQDTWLDIFARAFGGESDLPESIRNDLVRVGFIRVDGKGPDLFDTDYAVSARQIASVTGDRVTLTVDREALVRA